MRDIAQGAPVAYCVAMRGDELNTG